MSRTKEMKAAPPLKKRFSQKLPQPIAHSACLFKVFTMTLCVELLLLRKRKSLVVAGTHIGDLSHKADGIRSVSSGAGNLVRQLVVEICRLLDTSFGM